MRHCRMSLLFVLSAFAWTGGCKAPDDPLAASRMEASLKCERLAACYQALGNTTTVDTACDYDTEHVVSNCKNGCITRLWDEHDKLRAANEPIPPACRCVENADCASEVRYCDPATGACLH